MNTKVKSKKGITLIALVITIVILLILAMVSIRLVMNEGIIGRANNATNEYKTAEEKEKIELVKSELTMEKTQNPNVTEEKFQEIIDNVFGEGKATGEKSGDEYGITVKETGNSYIIKENGEIEGVGNLNNVKQDENPGQIEQVGTEYVINSIEDLVAFSYNVNNGTTYEGETVTLGRSLYFNGLFKSYVNENAKYVKDDIGYKAEESSETTIKELLTTGEGFIPIGTEDNPFKGSFDGKGYFIAEIYINSSKAAGLFGYNASPSIINTGIKGGQINSSRDIGGISAIANSNITIDNCYSDCILNGGSGTGYIGGIIGYVKESLIIKNCYNKGNLTESRALRSEGWLSWCIK